MTTLDPRVEALLRQHTELTRRRQIIQRQIEAVQRQIKTVEQATRCATSQGAALTQVFASSN